MKSPCSRCIQVQLGKVEGAATATASTRQDLMVEQQAQAFDQKYTFLIVRDAQTFYYDGPKIKLDWGPEAKSKCSVT